MGSGSSKDQEFFEVSPGGVAYASGRAVSAAITARIATVVEEGSVYTHNQLRRHFAYDRLLARVFADEADRWVLKGGSGLLARLPGRARHSLDVDLYSPDAEITAAVEALQEATEADVGDFFVFELTEDSPLGGHTVGMQLAATAVLAGKVFERFGVDVVLEAGPSAPPDVVGPLRPIELPGLWSPDYRTWPVADQLADKHLAMAAGSAGGRPSSRYYDLADVVLLATSCPVDAGELHQAVHRRYAARGLTPAGSVELPSPAWETEYPKVAAQAPGLSQQTAQEALAVARKLLEPVLQGRKTGRWDPDRLQWTI